MTNGRHLFMFGFSDWSDMLNVYAFRQGFELLIQFWTPLMRDAVEKNVVVAWWSYQACILTRNPVIASYIQRVTLVRPDRIPDSAGINKLSLIHISEPTRPY